MGALSDGCGSAFSEREMGCSGAQTEREVPGAASWCGVFHYYDCVILIHLTLLRNPHRAFSEGSWGRHSSEFKGASKHWRQKCRFNDRKEAGWLQGTLQTTSMIQKIHLTYLQHQVYDNAFASKVNLFCTFWMKSCCTTPGICFSLEPTQYDPAWAEIQ